MERKESSSGSVLINLPRGCRQYWEGQYDALTHCARILRQIANQNPTSQQLKRLASAIETKARLTAINKLDLRENHHET